MPNLVVKLDAVRHQVFPIADGETSIGRGDDNALVLPDASVSRHHARLTVQRGAAVIQDLDSQNGVLVNGTRIAQATRLKSRDKVQVGRFNVIFLADHKDDQFFNGRYVRYLPAYAPDDASASDESTMAMSVEALRDMQKKNRFVEGARLVREDNAKRFWYPEDRRLTLGASAMIPVEGLFTWGVCAEVWWDGKRHLIRRVGWLVSVSVNGSSVDTQPLRPGDQVQVGASRFKYEIADD
jgi:pSer/pThr/pTyr-binding forkhead associated (FHA) protein